MWRIEQIRTPEHFAFFRTGISALLECYRPVLMDDSCGGNPDVLIENLSGSIPLVWLLIQMEGEMETVVGLTSLTDIIPGRHAFIHGLSHPALRRHPKVGETAMITMAYAFEVFNLLKVKAEFEADNPGAKGFCIRMGFRKEGHFRQDNRVAGMLKDVLIYSLPREKFHALYGRCWSER